MAKDGINSGQRSEIDYENDRNFHARHTSALAVARVPIDSFIQVLISCDIISTCGTHKLRKVATFYASRGQRERATCWQTETLSGPQGSL
jgi:hypothetical protein